ncbi:MAG: entericidin [Muribaculaceae bacterium]|nr:entericidin [Muribaculaceae bacterium]
MKKLVYSLAVLFSVAMVSCGGNKAAENDSVNESIVEESVAVEVVTDSNAPAADSAAPAADSVKADSAK